MIEQFPIINRRTDWNYLRNAILRAYQRPQSSTEEWRGASMLFDRTTSGIYLVVT